MVLDFEKSGMKSAELIVAASGGTTLIAQQKHLDPHAAIDSAVHKLQAQLKRHKEKLQERGRKRRSES